MSYREMIRPIDMLEHEMRDRLAAKDAEIDRLRVELAAARREVEETQEALITFYAG